MFNKKHTSGILALFLSCSTLASTTPFNPALLNHIEISAAGGFSWIQTNNTDLIISPYETDSNQIENISNTPLWKIGAGYYFFEADQKQRNFLNRILLELNFYHTSASINGNVWQYQLPQFNNYSFSAPIDSNRLMLDLKPQLFTWRYFSPYAILGIGVAWNTISYQETVTGAGVDPTSYLSLPQKTNANIAYDLGAGIQVTFTKNLSGSVEYLYTHLGKVSPNGWSNSNAVIMTPPTFSIRNQAVLLGLIWKFNTG